jgi:hypothetical protein
MDKVKVLFLAADPSDSARLRLGQELRDIRDNLQRSKQRDSFLLESRESVRPRDITQAILDVEPQIVHFSGHGMSTGELCFEDIQGKTQPVKPAALASLFELFTEQVNCVVLNACYSEIQVRAIAKHIPFVIGMNQAIGDKAAITFAVGFYKALGAGRSIEFAYKLACAEIQLEGIPEHLTPILKLKTEKQNFASECDVDYSSLQSLLENKEWEKANEETVRLLLQASGRELFGSLDGGRESIGTLGDRDIMDLPCEDLYAIDNLWLKYSNGRFGFSVQLKVFQEEGDWERFTERVGWYSRDEIVFSLSSPRGHLPIPPPHHKSGYEGRLFWWNIATIVERLKQCQEIAAS